jgi:type IV secretory pathway VirB9-like protein
MACLLRPLTTALLGLTLATACAHEDPYPPAVPLRRPIPWENGVAFIVNTPPPPELAWKDPPRTKSPLAASLPTAEEWPLWQRRGSAQEVCHGKGSRRRCRAVTAASLSAVEQANASAIVRPTPLNTTMGTSAQTRYPLDLRVEKMYEVHTSPSEASYLLLPDGERLAAKMLLNPVQWEVTYGKNGAEGSRREVVAIRPTLAPLVARGLLVLQSGITIHLRLLAQERPGMLSVTWDVPRTVTTDPAVPLDQQPPKFDNAQAYDGYTVALEGKKKAAPPAWFPDAAFDDGKNTLIKFPGTLEGIRMPVVQGIQQTGKPALVQSRWYVRPEHGAWLYVQGLWPALRLQDGAGVQVTIVRQAPSQAQTLGIQKEHLHGS